MLQTFDQKLSQVNQRLKTANIAVNIERHYTKLRLRATLPPKPNSAQSQPSQQRISIGVSATLEGLKTAEAKAKELAVLLDQCRFDWSLYLSESTPPLQLIGDWVSEMENDYLTEGGKRETWEGEYLKVYRHLPLDEPLSLARLRSLLLKTDPNTRTRRRYALALAKLAERAGIEHDFKRLMGNYSYKAVNPRDIPSDEVIAYWFYQIKNPAWQCAYALQAVYGLRNYEIFKLDFSEFPVVFVHRGKTAQERYVYPLYPEWVDKWLGGCFWREFDLPNCNGKNSDLGNRVTHAFARMEIPFSPYNLRHAWARRALEFGWDLSLAAAQMGHDVQVHASIYHHWIKRDTYQRAYEILINRSDRPRPPTI